MTLSEEQIADIISMEHLAQFPCNDASFPAFMEESKKWAYVAARKIKEEINFALLEANRNAEFTKLSAWLVGHYPEIAKEYSLSQPVDQHDWSKGKRQVSRPQSGGQLESEVSAATESVVSERTCTNCGGLITVRNPTGKCDHLYYPEYMNTLPRGNCPECLNTVGKSQTCSCGWYKK